MKFTIALLFAFTLAAQTGSGPYGSYLGRDLRAAYAPGISLDGTGQTIGIMTWGVPYASDLEANFALNGRGVPDITTIRLPGGTWQPDSGSATLEATLDIVMASSMAPGAKIRLYVGGTTEATLARMAQDRDVSVFVSSFGFPDSPTAVAILQQIAMQGQTFFAAAGDYGPAQTISPASGPWVTPVAGTVLATAGPMGCRVGESPWPMSGTGVVVANAANVYIIGNNGQWRLTESGTSFAAPLWAGYVALVNEYRAQMGQAPVGYLGRGICPRSGVCSPITSTLKLPGYRACGEN